MYLEYPGIKIILPIKFIAKCINMNIKISCKHVQFIKPSPH